MTLHVLKAVLCGVIFGALAFFLPHLLIGLLIVFLIVRMFHGCCGHRHYRHGHKMKHLFVMADLIRKMSDEEYADFKAKMSDDDDCCGSNWHHGCCCGSKSDKACCETKKEETK